MTSVSQSLDAIYRGKELRCTMCNLSIALQVMAHVVGCRSERPGDGKSWKGASLDGRLTDWSVIKLNC